MIDLGGELFQKLEKAAMELGMPSPTMITMARRSVIHHFPDPKIRLAFVFTLIDECLDELDMTEEHAIELWKTGRRFL